MICLEELGDRRIFVLEIIEKITKKIRVIEKKITVAQSKQKAYPDRPRRPLEFMVEDKTLRYS